MANDKHIPIFTNLKLPIWTFSYSIFYLYGPNRDYNFTLLAIKMREL